MLKWRTLFFYTLLLLLPTVILALILKQMLEDEWARVEALSQETALLQAEACAGDIRNHLEALMAELRGIVPTVAGLHLDEARAHPLIRSPFIWAESSCTFQWPQEDTPEHLRLTAAYGSLFSGEEAFSPPQRELLRNGASSGSFGKKVLLPPRIGNGALGEVFSLPRSGRAGESLLLLCRREGGFVCGVDVNVPALYARLLPLLSQHVTAGYGMTLEGSVDSYQEVLMQTGTPLEEGARLSGHINLSLDFPELSVGMWAVTPAGVSRQGQVWKMFFVVTALGLLAGAATWIAVQLYRSRREVRTRTSFVSHVSHELRTPLTSIRLYAEMLQEGRVTDGEKAQRYLETMVRESERLTRLVNSVLDFGRLDQKRRVYRPEVFDAADHLERALGVHAGRLKEAGLAVEVTIEALPPLRVRLDADTFEQVVLNLLENAAKYAAEGKRLRIRLTREDGKILIAFTDAGPGIPRAARRRLFQPFYRADDSLTQATHGFGLGLYLSRRLLQEQGGDLIFSPAEGGGACFTVILPEEGA